MNNNVEQLTSEQKVRRTFMQGLFTWLPILIFLPFPGFIASLKKDNKEYFVLHKDCLEVFCAGTGFYKIDSKERLVFNSSVTEVLQNSDFDFFYIRFNKPRCAGTGFYKIDSKGRIAFNSSVTEVLQNSDFDFFYICFYKI